MTGLLATTRTRVGGLVDRARTSLFVVPTLFVAGGVLLAQVLLAVDRWSADGAFDVPFTGSTVGSARAVLTTLAAATIGFAGVAFSVSLLVVQMASNQYSPRVVPGILRDPFSKRVMGIVVGTFTYCLVVLRAIRDGGGQGEATAAELATSVAVVLGLVAILATIAFINHSAHSMDVSELLQTVTDDAVRVVRNQWPDDHTGDDDAGEGSSDGRASGEGTSGALHGGVGEPPEDAHRVRFVTSGWIQRIDHEALVAALPPDTSARLETAIGRYAVSGTPLCRYWPGPEDPDRARAVDRALRGAIQVGPARTSRQDVGYGIRQLADVGLRALSPGVNDPTTAQDAVFHLCVVLHELLDRRPPDAVLTGPEGRRLEREHADDHAGLVALAFDELRRSAANQPAVCVYLLEAIYLLCDSLDHPSDEGREALETQARLVVAGAEQAGLLTHDLDAIRRAHSHRF